jgi:hypothetical protein
MTSPTLKLAASGNMSVASAVIVVIAIGQQRQAWRAS